jgi:hypothetical protein
MGLRSIKRDFLKATWEFGRIEKRKRELEGEGMR